MIRKMQNPILAMLTGRIRVKGFSKMGRMRRLFPEPTLDQPISGTLFGG
jgi:putative sterol carrier protein